MRRLFSLAAVLVAFLVGTQAASVAHGQAYEAKPKLVVFVVIDQFRGDYLERYRADLKGRGFKLFLDEGAWFPDCYYNYANTKTAPGHATIGKALAIGLLVSINHSIAATFALLPKQLWNFADIRCSGERPILAYLISGACALTVGLSVSFIFTTSFSLYLLYAGLRMELKT